MTDQIPADQVREIVRKMYHHASHSNVIGTEEEYIRFFARQLDELVPAPTLADMTPSARRDCQWMQCEVRGDRRIIVLVLDDSDHCHAVTLDPYGYTSHCPFELVTPLPDLPRLEWPAPDEKVEDENKAKVGDVIQSADDPRLDALPVGTVLADCDGETVAKRSDAWAGLGYIPIESEGDEFGPWTVRRVGWETYQ